MPFTLIYARGNVSSYIASIDQVLNVLSHVKNYHKLLSTHTHTTKYLFCLLGGVILSMINPNSIICNQFRLLEVAKGACARSLN
jgi:hypothetical protein